MRRTLTWSVALAGSIVATSALAGDRIVPVPQPVDGPKAAPRAQDTGEDQALIDRLTALSKLIGRDGTSAQSWQYQLEQADVLLRLAGRGDGQERDKWLRLAIDSVFSVAVASPESDPSAYRRLADMPAQLRRDYPDSPAAAYAALKEVRAAYARYVRKAPDQLELAQEHLGVRLVRFAGQYSDSPEAPLAVQEAAQVCEAIGKSDAAQAYYRYLAEAFPNHELAKSAVNSGWRLAKPGEQIDLELPRVFPTGSPNESGFNIQALRGQLVVVYFWTSEVPQGAAVAQAALDFVALRNLVEGHPDRDLEVIYVNLDEELAETKDFLSNRTTGGVHLHQRGGLKSAVAQRFGLGALPTAMVVDKDGGLIRLGVPVAELEAAITGKADRE